MLTVIYTLGAVAAGTALFHAGRLFERRRQQAINGLLAEQLDACSDAMLAVLEASAQPADIVRPEMRPN